MCTRACERTGTPTRAASLSPFGKILRAQFLRLGPIHGMGRPVRCRAHGLTGPARAKRNAKDESYSTFARTLFPRPAQADEAKPAHDSDHDNMHLSRWRGRVDECAHLLALPEEFERHAASRVHQQTRRGQQRLAPAARQTCSTRPSRRAPACGSSVLCCPLFPRRTWISRRPARQPRPAAAPTRYVRRQPAGESWQSYPAIKTVIRSFRTACSDCPLEHWSRRRWLGRIWSHHGKLRTRLPTFSSSVRTPLLKPLKK